MNVEELRRFRHCADDLELAANALNWRVRIVIDNIAVDEIQVMASQQCAMKPSTFKWSVADMNPIIVTPTEGESP
jgi:hypothetical protein